MTDTQDLDLAEKIGNVLPFLRRYARALTGSQAEGDQYAALTLETILSDPQALDQSRGAKVALFRVFHSLWSSSGATLLDEENNRLAAQAQKHLRVLTKNSREALLLHTIEDLSLDQVGHVMGIEGQEAGDLLDIAYAEMAKTLSGQVMIIEDEAIIADDLEELVVEMGHSVTGIADTAQKAVSLAQSRKPDCILSDIQLADGSSGIDAVTTLLASYPDMPVIFITAFPERLLTGEGAEPAFLISKPYTEDQVRSAVSQAMFFSSTDELLG